MTDVSSGNKFSPQESRSQTTHLPPPPPTIPPPTIPPPTIPGEKEDQSYSIFTPSAMNEAFLRYAPKRNQRKHKHDQSDLRVVDVIEKKHGKKGKKHGNKSGKKSQQDSIVTKFVTTARCLTDYVWGKTADLRFGLNVGFGVGIALFACHAAFCSRSRY